MAEHVCESSSDCLGLLWVRAVCKCHCSSRETKRPSEVTRFELGETVTICASEVFWLEFLFRSREDEIEKSISWCDEGALEIIAVSFYVYSLIAKWTADHLVHDGDCGVTERFDERCQWDTTGI
ncbi:hypothetical protein ACFR99_04620 [Haloarchaeobius amylolyticus]|uniref:Uncharacterized protein n=1 Tax=Haloarchaeobius amylolyticus TaxID=1198296 RepID=A0ABD6BF94_9EURY